MKPAAAGRLFIETALEEAGIAVLPVEADMVDSRARGTRPPRARRYVSSSTQGACSERESNACAGAGVEPPVSVAATHARVPVWWLPFVATLVAMFTMQLSNLGFSPLLPAMQQDLGMSFTQLGLFTGIYGLLAMLTSRAGRLRGAPVRREARAGAGPDRPGRRQRAAGPGARASPPPSPSAR